MYVVSYAGWKQSMVRRMGGVIVAAFCVSLALPAQAGESDKTIARAHYETATRLYEVREYEEALKEYKAAYVAKPDAAFLFNIGQCYRKLDKNAEALDFFQQFLKKSPPDDPNRTQVEARIRNIEAGLNSNYDPFDKPAAAQPQPPAAKVKASPPPIPVPQPAYVPPPPPLLPEPAQLPTAKPSPPAEQPASQRSFTPAIQPAGLDLTAATPRKEAGGSSAFYTTWWFWTGVGAVVAAGTVTAIVLSSSGSGTKNPSSTLGARTVFP